MLARDLTGVESVADKYGDEKKSSGPDVTDGAPMQQVEDVTRTAEVEDAVQAFPENHIENGVDWATLRADDDISGDSIEQIIDRTCDETFLRTGQTEANLEPQCADEEEEREDFVFDRDEFKEVRPHCWEYKGKPVCHVWQGKDSSPLGPIFFAALHPSIIRDSASKFNEFVDFCNTRCDIDENLKQFRWKSHGYNDKVTVQKDACKDIFGITNGNGRIVSDGENVNGFVTVELDAGKQRGKSKTADVHVSDLTAQAWGTWAPRAATARSAPEDKDDGLYIGVATEFVDECQHDNRATKVKGELAKRAEWTTTTDQLVTGRWDPDTRYSEHLALTKKKSGALRALNGNCGWKTYEMILCKVAHEFCMKHSNFSEHYKTKAGGPNKSKPKGPTKPKSRGQNKSQKTPMQMTKNHRRKNVPGKATYGGGDDMSSETYDRYQDQPQMANDDFGSPAQTVEWSKQRGQMSKSNQNEYQAPVDPQAAGMGQYQPQWHPQGGQMNGYQAQQYNMRQCCYHSSCLGQIFCGSCGQQLQARPQTAPAYNQGYQYPQSQYYVQTTSPQSSPPGGVAYPYPMNSQVAYPVAYPMHAHGIIALPQGSPHVYNPSYQYPAYPPLPQ